MTTFIEYFSDTQIIAALCRARVKLAKQRHDAAYTYRLAGRHFQLRHDDELSGLLPPRKTWARFRPRIRQAITNVDLASLQVATLSLRSTNPTLPWVARLNVFVHRIRQRVQDYGFAFSVPKVRWEPKDTHKYRAIAMFNLEDNVICGLTAQYLKDFIDPAFESSSYAFRAIGSTGTMPTHHTAFERLYEIRLAAGRRKRLYVAECDIRGFYDSVDHGVAWNSFLRVVARREQLEPRRNFDPRAAIIFKAYLDCYSFPHNVLGDAAARLKEQDSAGEFPWPAKELAEFHTYPDQARIGVPQGGAISCIIANLVLDAADKRMETIKQRIPGLEYLRYCDDMILVAPRKRECTVAFAAYLAALKELKLPYHPPKKVRIYGPEFWADGMKSKAPYCWSAKRRPSHVPWVQFVGYQVRYDGLVRPKPKSVNKHGAALREIVDTLKWALVLKSRPLPGVDKIPVVSAGRAHVENSLVGKLVSMSVGRVDPENPKCRPLPLCWANGFKALHDKPLVPTFLKRLDRERERQIRRFMRAPIAYEPERPSRGSRWRAPRGYLFSYHAQFRNRGGRKLIENP
jgi:hypothetical protein